ncbi:PxKF domain-containing protein [Streptomyces sp. NBC_00212]|uniref:PxKF domain-containing protein n=1 Tax=Streptomyces sp. NBC_00212 TaxID=2975684 RepID=UPI00325081A6
MSRSRTIATPAGRARWSLRTRLTALFAGAVLVSAGLFTLAAPAQADSIVQINDSADPVTVNTSYTYVVNVNYTTDADVDQTTSITLSGAAATFTAVTSSNPNDACFANGVHAHCDNAGYHGTSETITLTVLPTAAGTVTASAAAVGDAYGSDSTTTTITAAGPVYTFSGFFQPVDNPPTVNTMNAGRAVPVKFSLSGNQGLDIFATGYPASQHVTCNTGAPLAPIEQTSSAGQSSLTYDPVTDTYTYVWKTDRAWKDTCRTFDLKLADGSDHTANFKFS